MIRAPRLLGYSALTTSRKARKAAQTVDDLALMKEYEFLQILPTISVIGKNVKQELEQCLKLRNACGHPNSLSIGEHRVLRI
jgi:hypothetical protein